MRKTLLVILGVALAVALIVWFVFFPPQTPYSVQNTPSQVLLKTNDHFVQALSLRDQGNNGGAEAAYTNALQEAKDSTQQGQITLFLSTLQNINEQNPLKAIQLCKDIAANESYPPDIRAYAVQWLARMDREYADPQVTAAIFSTAPYSGMWVQGDLALTRRRLAEYAASFYPLGLPEAYIAQWYSKQLISTTSSTLAARYQSIIAEQFKYIEADLARERTMNTLNKSFPHILREQANVKADLVLAKRDDPKKAESLYKRAVTTADEGLKPQNLDGFARIDYAAFLAKEYGSARVSDIHNLLAPLSQESYAHSLIYTHLTNIRANPDFADEAADARKLASLDSGFKSLLLKLGWQQSDFK